MDKIAIIAITKHGAKLGEKLQKSLPGSQFFLSAKFKEEVSIVPNFFEVPIKNLTREIFNQYEALIYVVSLGAVIRTIAPYLKDKHTDPAVIVVDDKANFAISVLSGHVGGANALTEDVAKILGATPVITTASDVGKTIPVDILGRELGWTTELDENITKVSASVVNEELVGIYQDAGEKNWWKRDVPLPKNFKFFSSLEELAKSECKAALIITDKIIGEQYRELLKKSVLYRPKSLAIGMGCDKGVAQEQLDTLLHVTFSDNGLSVRSIKNVSTVDLKNREAGLLSFCQRHGWELVCYTREELVQLKDILPNPSEMVMKYLKIPGVSEPAAMLTAKTDQLVIQKTKGAMATLAVARINFKIMNSLENIWQALPQYQEKGAMKFDLGTTRVTLYMGAMEIPMVAFHPKEKFVLGSDQMEQFSKFLSTLNLELDCVEEVGNYKINRAYDGQYLGRVTKDAIKLHLSRIQEAGWDIFKGITEFFI